MPRYLVESIVATDVEADNIEEAEEIVVDLQPGADYYEVTLLDDAE